MASGLKLGEDLLAEIQTKLLKHGSVLTAMTIKLQIDGKKEALVLDQTFNKEGFEYDSFTNAFPDKEGRIGILKHGGKTDDGRPLVKVILILWAPMTSSPIQRMKISSCFGAVKDQLSGVDKHIQCDNIADISLEKIEELIRK